SPDPRGDFVVAGVVLAAGAGTRFGGAKQLAVLDGRPLLEHALRAMAGAPVDFVVLVLGARADEIRLRVGLHGATGVVASGWEAGQAASLRAGVAAARDRGADAVVITLGDQPRISSDAIARVAAADADAARATYDGVPAHPVLLRSPRFDAVAALSG